MDRVSWESVCVCADGYYQTSDVGNPLVCAACPTGSTTGGNTNRQDISACGKNGKLSFQFLDILSACGRYCKI